MTEHTTNQVVVYHDETRGVGDQKYKGHVLFFVPTRVTWTFETPMFGTQSNECSSIQHLYNKVMEMRRQHRLMDKKLHFSELGGKRWTAYDLATYKIVAATVDALRYKGSVIFRPCLCCKVAAIFYPKLADRDLYRGNRREQELRHDETMMRILLKGALHYLYSESSEILVTRLVSDGKPSHRPLDEDRVLWQITVDDRSGRTPLRDYAAFAPDAEIVHTSSDHKKHVLNSPEYVDANMLQLADMLLGGMMRACTVGCQDVATVPFMGDSRYAKKDVIAQPVKHMLDKTQRGAGFRNSGHYGAFTITQVSFSDRSIHFHRVEPKQIEITGDAKQMRFPF